MKLAFSLLVLVCLTACSHAPLVGGTTPVSEQRSANDPLKHLNEIFRDNYGWQRQEMLRTAGPWIWVTGDQLVLFYKGQREEGTGISARYHLLKTFCHVPLAVFVILATDVDDALSTQAVQRASDFRSEIASLKKALPQFPLRDKERTRQRQMLEQADDFLEHALHGGRVEAEALHRFSRSQRQPVLANILDAARAQIETTDAQLRIWRKQLGNEAWNQLTVVISGPSTPRARNLVTQYFAKLLHEKGEGRRIIYAENLFTEPTVKDRLGTDILDGEIGDAFFDDDRRMHRDLLSDAASEILREFP